MLLFTISKMTLRIIQFSSPKKSFRNLHRPFQVSSRASNVPHGRELDGHQRIMPYSLDFEQLGWEYGEISKKLPGHNKGACRAQGSILVKRKANNENEPVQKTLWSWE